MNKRIEPQPICDQESEDAVIASCMLSPAAWEIARDIVRPGDFFLARNRDIFWAIEELDAAGTKVDVVTLVGLLRSRNKLENVGGAPEIGRLLEATPAVAHVADHARRVVELSRQRRVVEACRLVCAEGATIVPNVEEFCALAEREVCDAARADASTDSPEDLGVVAARVTDQAIERLKRGAKLMGYSSGFTELDRRISGWCAGLYVIAGRPGMGKTAFTMDVGKGIARSSNELFVFLCLEMPNDDLGLRALASEARVNIMDLRSGNIRGREDVLTSAAADLSRIPISIKFAPGATLRDLRTAIRKAQQEQELRRGRKLKIAAVAVDYIQLMTAPRRPGGNREQEVSDLSRALKLLSGELVCPVLALSQLNRSVETRNVKDKRPQLSDLRESGAIEQDADAIFFLYRDEYYFEDSPDKGLAEVIVAKQRNGPTGTVKVKFTPQYARFSELPADEYDWTDEMPEPPWNERAER